MKTDAHEQIKAELKRKWPYLYRDYTALKAENAALKQSNENLRSALEDGIVRSVELELADDAFATPPTGKVVVVDQKHYTRMHVAICIAQGEICGHLCNPGKHLSICDELASLSGFCDDPPTGKVPVEIEKLRAIEWFQLSPRDIDGNRECPCCYHYPEDGHAPDCWLAALLKEDS